jgi:hypothetical protein
MEKGIFGKEKTMNSFGPHSTQGLATAARPIADFGLRGHARCARLHAQTAVTTRGAPVVVWPPTRV